MTVHAAVRGILIDTYSLQNIHIEQALTQICHRFLHRHFIVQPVTIHAVKGVIILDIWPLHDILGELGANRARFPKMNKCFHVLHAIRCINVRIHFGIIRKNVR